MVDNALVLWSCVLSCVLFCVLAWLSLGPGYYFWYYVYFIMNFYVLLCNALYMVYSPTARIYNIGLFGHLTSSGLERPKGIVIGTLWVRVNMQTSSGLARRSGPPDVYAHSGLYTENLDVCKSNIYHLFIVSMISNVGLYIASKHK